jgi:type II secretion system protein D
MPIAVFVLFLWLYSWPVASVCNGDDKAAPAETPQEVIKVSMNYTDWDPKLLFQRLSDNYLVQFDGGDTVTGTITLVSKEKVDVTGMLGLLNESLAKQGKEAKLEGKNLIRIVPVQDLIDKTIKLEKADPVRVREILIKRYASTGEQPEDKIRKPVYIEVHPQGDALIVRGPKKVIQDMEEYIHKELDINLEKPAEVVETKTPEAPKYSHYFTLDYMDAAAFEELLKNDASLQNKIESHLGLNNTNTLVVLSHDQTIFSTIAELQKKFDVDRKELRYIPLAYAQAKDIAALLNEVYKAATPPEVPAELQKARLSDRQQAESDQERSLDKMRRSLASAGTYDEDIIQRLSRAISLVSASELTIVPDLERNSLLVYTFSRNFPRILEMIAKLDLPRRQVFIEVFITEVELDDRMQLGVDFTYGQDFGSGPKGTYSVTQGFQSLFPTTGLSYQVISDNVSGFFHALTESGRLDVMVRPQVLVKDNTEAEISLGRDVPLIKNTTVSSEGSTTSIVEYKEVLTDLKVTPQIHPDGYVSLTINQVIDDVSSETFQISETFNPQVLIRRKAITQLRIKDGQTVCMGGFIGDNITETESKVPLLGDIPILGELFKYSNRQRVKNELIIFITPHILETPEETLRMTNKQRDLSNVQKRDDRNTEPLEPKPSLNVPAYKDKDQN